MPITKASIIADIQRTAAENDGVPLGQGTFERDTGVSVSSWRGKYWRNWGEALREAGFAANLPNKAHDRSFLILNLVELTQKNRRFPTYADMRMEREANKSFPGHQALSNLGTLTERIELVRQYAKVNTEYDDLLAVLPPEQEAESDTVSFNSATGLSDGYVYMGLLKIGSEKRYKIGKTNLVERRKDQISVQLPADLELVHAIKTDDAYGIEAYWHRRFAMKQAKGEWFSLSRDDVLAFKRRKFM